MVMSNAFFVMPYMLILTLSTHFCYPFTAKFFFERLVNYMSSGEMEALVLAHPRAVEKWRDLMGPTKPTQAQALAPSSIRSMHGLTDTRNSVHGSG